MTTRTARFRSPGMPRRIHLPFFYGWLLVAIAFVTMAVGVNARTGFSLLFPAMLDEFGWERGMTAGAFSFGFLVSALVTPFVGRLMDRRGPRLSSRSASCPWAAVSYWRHSFASRGSFI
jgi:MFS family permease